MIPVTKSVYPYAEEVRDKLWSLGIFSEADLSENTLPKKIRNGEIAQYNFILVVGHTEMETRSVNVRNRDDQDQKGQKPVIPFDQVCELLLKLKQEKRLENKLGIEADVKPAEPKEA